MDLPKNLTGLSLIDGINWALFPMGIDKERLWMTSPFSIIKHFDFDGFRLILAHVKTVFARVNRVCASFAELALRKRSYIKAFIGGDVISAGLINPTQINSMAMFMATKKRIIDAVHPWNIPRKCWCQPEGEFDEKEQLQIPL